MHSLNSNIVGAPHIIPFLDTSVAGCNISAIPKYFFIGMRRKQVRVTAQNIKYAAVIEFFQHKKIGHAQRFHDVVQYSTPRDGQW